MSRGSTAGATSGAFLRARGVESQRIYFLRVLFLRTGGPMRPFKSILKLAIVLLPSASLCAQPANPKPNAPDRYVVRPGDSLWGIAGRFTDSPQKWTEIWQLNKERIQNPNVLRPGEVILLDPVRRQASGSSPGGVAPEKLPPPAPPAPPTSGSGSASSGSASSGSASSDSTSSSGSSTGGAKSGGTAPRPAPSIEPISPWPRPPRRE
jgi:LysM domain